MFARRVATGLLISVATVLCAPPAPAGAAEDAFAVYSGGVDGLLVDDRDAVLRQALKLLGQRVEELPAELGEPGMPGPLIRLVAEMLMQPMSLRMGMVEGAAENGDWPPFYVQLLVEDDDEETARQRARTLLEVFMQATGQEEPQDVADLSGLKMIDLDGAPLYLGTGSVGDRPMFVAALARPDLQPPRFDGVELPDGITPAFALTFDGAQLAPLMDIVLAEAPPDEQEAIRAQLEMSGIGGEHPARLDLACGYGEDLAHCAMRYRNYAQMPGYSTMISTARITADDLALVPADATVAEVWKARHSALPVMLREMMSRFVRFDEEALSGLEDPIGALSRLLNVDLEQDLFAHLADTGGAYMSDRTGGGGFTSLVVFVAVDNSAAVRGTLARIADSLNAMAGEHAHGYVRLQQRVVHGHAITTLMFPGLPVPLEVSWAVAGERLLFAVTPSALCAAIDFVEEGGDGLAAHPRFAQLAPKEWDDVAAFTFYDLPRLAGRGYGMANLALSALSNAVRSPRDPARDPGLIMPSYDELLGDARGSLTVTRLRGADLLVDVRGDRSTLVGLSALAGVIGGSTGPIMVGALGAGVLLPAVGEARAQATSLKSMTQLRQIGMCMQIYASDEGDRLPASVDVLIERDYMGREMIASPHGSVGDGRPDMWINTSVARLSDVEEPHLHIAGYDRASYAYGEKVNVLFYDAHVESVWPWEFQEMITDPRYEGVDFDLP